MRTTVTLDPDTAALVRRRIRERDLSFKQVLNEAVRAGLTHDSTESPPFRTRTAEGVPLVELDAALTLAGDLENAELLRKMRMGK